jgi:putative colanic acid biosynthesis acetyltransferase WcaF
MGIDMTTRSVTKIAANRAARKWSMKEQAGRMAWSILWPLFRVSPRPYFWGWRRMLLRLCGAKIASHVHLHPSVRIAIPWNLDLGSYAAVGDGANLYSLGPIRIGARVTISQGAHLCAGTHDWRDPAMPLLKPPIVIEPDAWICADAYVGPGVTVGEAAIVGARAVVTKDVAPAAIVVGNPAREIKTRHT